MKPFLIIKTGSTFSELAAKKKDFIDWTAHAMGLGPSEWVCVDAQAGESLPDPTAFAGCVLTGSHDMVTDRTAWMKTTAAWLRDSFDTLPIFGICFGHQIMADAFGGTAGFHPNGPEIGTVTVSLHEAGTTDPLFSQLPALFPAHVTHSQTALSLPADAVLLASSDHEAHQAFRMGSCAWGIQFHPEFDGEATRHYVRMQEDTIVKHGDDVESILNDVRETPESTSLLRRFVVLCRT